VRSTAVRLPLAALGVPVLFTTAVLVLREAWSDRLPEEVATHWGPSGAPDDATSLGALTTWTVVATLVLAVAFTVTALVLVRIGRGSYPPLLGLASGLAVIPVAGLATSMLATLDAPSWHDASGAGLSVLVLLGTSVAAGVLSWLVAPDVPPRRASVPVGSESVGLTRGERVTWMGGTTNVGLAVLCVVAPPAVLAVVGALAGSPTSWSTYLVPLGLGVLAAVGISRVHVTIDNTAVTIRMGFTGYPRRTVPISDITSAGTDSLSLLQGGGLGVRTNASGDVAFKCRSGEALVLTLSSGRRVLATVDGPDQAAGLVNDLVRQAHDRQG
jgi:hypothetical protein